MRELGRQLAEEGRPVVSLAALASERTAPWAFLARVARAVVHLPGGLGIAPEHAATLLAIAPDLATRRVGVASQGVPSDEGLVAATADLLSAANVAQTFTPLLDDLHFADSASIEVLSRVIDGVYEDEGPTVIAGSRLGQHALPSHWPRWQVTPLRRPTQRFGVLTYRGFPWFRSR